MPLKIDTLVEEYKKFISDGGFEHLENCEQLVGRAGIGVRGHCLAPPINETYEKVKHFFGGFKCKQYPRELGAFLKFIYEHSQEIQSYLEVGTERAGTFFMVDSLLRAIHGEDFVSTGIEYFIGKGTGRDLYYKSYVDLHPNVVFLEGDSAHIAYKDQYGLCLIDGNHQYEPVKTDYNNLVGRSKFLAFHDIKLPGNGVAGLWDEIKDRHQESWEFINDDPAFVLPVGIGVIRV